MENRIDFKGENEGDYLEIGLDQLLFVQSSGNYIEVVYKVGGHVNKSILRNSLSNAEELLSDQPCTFRCYRNSLAQTPMII